MTTPSTTRERLYLFDTTLRDGAQTQGVALKDGKAPKTRAIDTTWEVKR